MSSSLATTGTAALLATLSPHVPDAFIHEQRGFRQGQGRRPLFSDAQLWRAHLLALLTPAHSFNLLVQLLPEQRDWRRFARFSHRQRTPGVRTLHEFRVRLGVTGLRAINAHLVRRLLPRWPAQRLPVAVIDSTDLPAATADSQKKRVAVFGRRNGPRWGRARSSPGTRAFSSATRSTVCGSAGRTPPPGRS
jgi:hypothetical protein